jgi:protein O-mannosyl-transferase
MSKPAFKAKPPPKNASPSPVWLSLLLAAATIIAYLPALRGGFIWDDDDHLTNNPCVVGPLGFKEIWTSYATRICPLVISCFRVQYSLWGLDPLPYHLFTILMHACAAIVLWRVLLRLQVPGAWFGAALWALHPVQVESVAWITELKNTQSGFFYMLTGLFFVRARLAAQAQDAPRTRKNDWAALGFAVLAMASKSSTVVLPLVLGLFAWWIERGWRWRTVLRLAPYFALSAMSSALSLWTQGAQGLAGPDWARSWPERIVTAGQVVWFYQGKLL